MLKLDAKGIGQAIGIGWDYLTDEVRRDSDIVAKAQFKKVVEWEFGICTDHQESYAIGMKRIDCPQCRQALLEEVKDECKHEWVSMRNEVITSGEFCPKCNAVRSEATLEEVK